MPGMLTRIKYIYPVWLAIKWLVIVMIVSRSGGCGDDYGRAAQRTPPSDDWITITNPFDTSMFSAHRNVYITPVTLVRTV